MSKNSDVDDGVELVRQTVKLTRHDWERMLDLRKTHRVGFQQAAITGINRLLADLGQEPLEASAGTFAPIKRQATPIKRQATLDAELQGKHGLIRAETGTGRGGVAVYGRLNRKAAGVEYTGIYMPSDLRARIDRLSLGTSIGGAMVALLAYACEIVEREMVEISFHQNKG